MTLATSRWINRSVLHGRSAGPNARPNIKPQRCWGDVFSPLCRLSGLWVPLVLSTLAFPGPASAYIGPGAGFAFLGSFFAFFLALVLAFLAAIGWPIRYVLRLRKNNRDATGDRKIRKAIVVGFDGMEPSLVERFTEQGFLPNFSRLKQCGTYCPLGTTLPPLSPVAWSTFQTGVNPGKHAIFDFIRRNPRTYLGELSSARIQPHPRTLKIGGLRIPLGKPVLRGLRKSKPFWSVLGDHGIFSIVLRVPITFPPERFRGMSLSGMCVPDLRGTQGTFTHFTDRPEAADPPAARGTVHVRWEGNASRTRIDGPTHPFRAHEAALACPLLLKRNGQSLLIRIDGVESSVPMGRYTPWVPVAFRAGPFRIRGIVRFYLRRLEPFLDLYMTPVNIDPDNPALPISHPREFSMYLAKKQGPFATLGLAEDTSALNEGILDDDAFLQQCLDIHQEREKTFWDALEHVRDGLLVSVFDLTDRIQHMFWRYEDPLHPARPLAQTSMQNVFREVYQRADAFLGRLLDRLDSNTLLLVISDHGFRSFRRSVNLNTWLCQQGYLVLRPSEEAGEWFRSVDWSRSKAFAVGLAGIYINQRGRESSGIVDPGEETERVKEEIARGLKCLRDPAGGDRDVLDVVDTRRFYHGPYTENAPDLIVGFEEGYRTSWESATGKVTDAVFSDNVKMWSGDHCSRPDQVPGVFFANQRLRGSNPRLVDLAPTLLKAFGIEPPEYMDGRPFDFEWEGLHDSGEEAQAGAERPLGRKRGEVMASKIKIDKELLKKVRHHARTAGYASEEEFVAHALEKEIARLETVEPEEEVKRKLEGLGYIG